jgi:hypothetical protein
MGCKMRANGKDIVEIFGFSPEDSSPSALTIHNSKYCPFTKSQCIKYNHDKTEVYGVCSVSEGSISKPHSDVVICPNRLYADNYSSLQDAALLAWPQNLPFVIGGNLDDLRSKAKVHNECIVAFGKGSGKEISVKSNGRMSLDWVLQHYTYNNKTLKSHNYIGIEVQSIDITGNYRENRAAYEKLRTGIPPLDIPNSGHGLNWANVVKRLMQQIIRKGNIYRSSPKCVGFFFIVPEIVYQRFEASLGQVPTTQMPANDNLSVLTYALDPSSSQGKSRRLKNIRHINYKVQDVINAFSSNAQTSAWQDLEDSLSTIL